MLPYSINPDGSYNYFNKGVFVPNVNIGRSGGFLEHGMSRSTNTGRRMRRNHVIEDVEGIPDITFMDYWFDQAGTIPAACYDLGKYLVAVGSNLDLDGLSYVVRDNQGNETPLAEVLKTDTRNVSESVTEVATGSGSANFIAYYTISKTDFESLEEEDRNTLLNQNDYTETEAEYKFNLYESSIGTDRSTVDSAQLNYTVSPIGVYSNYTPPTLDGRLSIFVDVRVKKDGQDVLGTEIRIEALKDNGTPFYVVNAIDRFYINGGNISGKSGTLLVTATNGDAAYVYAPTLNVALGANDPDGTYTVELVEATLTHEDWFNPSATTNNVEFFVYTQGRDVGSFTQQKTLHKLSFNVSGPSASIPAQVIESKTIEEVTQVTKCIEHTPQ